MVKISYVMKVLWKILCISCCSVASLLVRGTLLGMIEGTEEWMAEWRNKGDEGGVGLLLGRLVAGVKEKVWLGSTGLLWEMCSSGGRGGNI